MSDRFHDPEGSRFGVPTYPWRQAPAHLRTRRQLAQENLRPGAEWEAQALRGRRGGRDPLKAYLYDADSAVPKRESTEAQLESLRIARSVRSADACERHGVDATDMRELIEQARTDLAARRRQRSPRPGVERGR
jgi:hypothetical protein